MNPRIKNPRKMSPRDLKAGDVFVTTIVCHVRDSQLEKGELAFKLYDCGQSPQLSNGIPQGNPLYSENDTEFGRTLFFPLLSLKLKHEE